MGLFEFPNPIGWYEGAKNANLERHEVNAFVSALYSATIAFMWRVGQAKWAKFTGLGPALQDAATSIYLTLESQLEPGFLTLTVTQDMLDADNLSRFQTEKKEKPK